MEYTRQTVVCFVQKNCASTSGNKSRKPVKARLKLGHGILDVEASVSYINRCVDITLVTYYGRRQVTGLRDVKIDKCRGKHTTSQLQ